MEMKITRRSILSIGTAVGGLTVGGSILGAANLMSASDWMIILKREMPIAVKSLKKVAIPGLLLLFVGLCFPQSKAKVQETPLKANAAEPKPSANPQTKSTEEEKIPPPAPNAIFPAVVARVNGTAILGRDLEALVREELRSIGNPEWKNLRGEYRGELTLSKMTALINSKLLYQKAAASGINVPTAEVKSELQKFARTFKSEAEMNEALAREHTDRTSLEKRLHENLVTSKYVEETVNKKVVVTPEEVAQYYSSNSKEFHHPDIVRTSHILIRAAGNGPDQDAKAKERAEALLIRIQKGEDFAKLARENSMDSYASQGGDIGFAYEDELAPEYSEAAFSLPLGAVRLVKTQDGYHIIKVVDKKSEGQFTLEDVKAQLHKRLKNQKSQENLNALINQLRAKANIEIMISARELLSPLK
jgi:peptidyl-prolyl cis-trans isomerase C